MKNKAAKIFTAIISLILAITCLGACSGDTKDKEETTGGTEIVQNPIATITMANGGVIKVELYYDTAPNTVRNFISLANKGFYNGVIFHRVKPGFVIQGGSPDGSPSGHPGYCIKGEFAINGVQNDLKHERGVISMARAQDFDSAGSQFFICADTAASLDKQYAAFGRVIEGMDVVDEIISQEAVNERPVNDQVMSSVTVETFGVEYAEPETLPRPY